MVCTAGPAVVLRATQMRGAISCSAPACALQCTTHPSHLPSPTQASKSRLRWRAHVLLQYLISVLAWFSIIIASKQQVEQCFSHYVATCRSLMPWKQFTASLAVIWLLSLGSMVRPHGKRSKSSLTSQLQKPQSQGPQPCPARRRA